MDDLPNADFEAPLSNDGITQEMVAMGIAAVNRVIGSEYPRTGCHPSAEQVAVAAYRAMRVGAITKSVQPPPE